MTPSLVVIAEPEGEACQRLIAAAKGACADDTAVAPTLEGALAIVAERTADVLVAGPGTEPASVYAAMPGLSGECGAGVVLAAEAVDADLLRAALRAGVDDVVALADPLEDISAAIGRGLEASRRLRGAVAEGAAEAARAKVVTVFSTKGGVGKTVLATNLGVALARDTGKRVAVIDLDLEFGDVAIMLGLQPTHTIYDASQVFDRLDADLLAGFMETHGSGLRALLAPLHPEEAESISAARIGQVLDLMREEYDYVVVDTSPSFSEAVLAALDRSDEVFVVTMMDVASIKNTRISLQKLRQLGYPDSHVRIVLNRSDSKVLLEASEVESAIGGRVVAHIPSDRIVPRSVNKGVPVVLEMPKSEVARAILALAHEAASPAARKGA
ncbi:MAG: hypothetical protein FDZ70_04300 [Actinobacteria bacterium]|nr:MAG: hypothetical protein FDZ70_04300 [Actinomycetota bacterium]